MSDQSQGPGWWVASDGRWYPPEQHPSTSNQLMQPPVASRMCRHCGSGVSNNAAVCLACGCQPDTGFHYCGSCGAQRHPNASICLTCGVALTSATGGGYGAAKPAKSKVTAGLLAIFLGGFGVHKFYLGYTTEGVITVVGLWVIGLATFGIGFWILGILIFIEGIIYLTKSDEDFQRIYVDGKKGWF